MQNQPHIPLINSLAAIIFLQLASKPPKNLISGLCCSIEAVLQVIRTCMWLIVHAEYGTANNVNTSRNIYTILLNNLKLSTTILQKKKTHRDITLSQYKKKLCCCCSSHSYLILWQPSTVKTIFLVCKPSAHFKHASVPEINKLVELKLLFRIAS